jgi:hypothetical protein
MQEPPDAYPVVGSESPVSVVGDHARENKLPDAETPFRYAAPTTMMALKFCLFGSRNKEQSEMNISATIIGPSKFIICAIRSPQYSLALPLTLH